MNPNEETQQKLETAMQALNAAHEHLTNNNYTYTELTIKTNENNTIEIRITAGSPGKQGWYKETIHTPLEEETARWLGIATAEMVMQRTHPIK